jgi:hypothetical protein
MTPYLDYMQKRYGISLVELSKLETEILKALPWFIDLPDEHANQLVEYIWKLSNKE